MSKEIIITSNAPAAIGPYSQGVKIDKYLFCSGQIPINPKTGEQIRSGIKDQTTQVLENLKGIIEAAGSTLENVVKVTIYISSMDYFKEINEVYASYFKVNPPARATVAVKGLPLGFDVEMDAFAIV